MTAEPITKEYLLSDAELLAKIKTIPRIRDKAYICFLYLTGNRVEEVVPYPHRNLSGIMVRQIILETVDGVACIKFKDLPTIKRHKIKIRRKGKVIGETPAPIPLHSISYRLQDELPFITPIITYLQEFTNPDAVLFPFTRRTGLNICRKYISTGNHYFRHLRCYRDVDKYGFNPLELQHARNWATMAMGEKYVRLNDRDILRKRIRIIQGKEA